ncbi:MAG: aspartate/tyrosine/aromatic aminotransferase [Propionibacteriaceae bacterium]|jgi:aromatic-amino-acid transaminase|nr:aspartate/tyrosine/aromatic aminotransferase [Propionibacteriaceae bacterium]
MSLFTNLPAAPRDPVLGITEAFRQDSRPGKVNLGVGVYLDETGAIPLLECVQRAEAIGEQSPKPWGYLPIDGLSAYDSAVAKLVFGADSPAVAEGRVTTVQSLGGTGGLRLGAGLLALVDPSATVLVSDPSWENHEALFSRAGFAVGRYPYYDPARRGVDVEAMLAGLAAADPGTIVVLHACCHNPTGYDLSAETWERVLEVVAERGLVPFLDMAYQGFATGIDEDAAVVRRFAESGLSCLVATSFSKTFSLYGERVGAINVVSASPEEAATVLSQVKVVQRTLISNPPTHGARLVSTVLGSEDLTGLWHAEVAGMRERIRTMRSALRDGLADEGIDAAFVTEQTGMFSYSGLSADQMRRLRADHAVYGLDSGRLCVAALNPDNLGRVVAAVAEVSRAG